MNDRLAEFYQGVAVHATADSEHTAALELLALVMAADRTSSDGPSSTRSRRSPTTGGTATSRSTSTSVRRSPRPRTAIASGEVLQLIDDIDQRISSRVLRRALFSAAREVAGVDDDVTPEEGSDPRRSRRPLRIAHAVFEHDRDRDRPSDTPVSDDRQHADDPTSRSDAPGCRRCSIAPLHLVVPLHQPDTS